MRDAEGDAGAIPSRRVGVISVAGLARRTTGVRRNALWLLLGNAVYAASYWVQFMILAKAGGPSAVGSYAYALALAAPAVGFASLQLRSLLASDAVGAYALREYLTLRFAATGTAMVAVLLVGWAISGTSTLRAVLASVCVMRMAEGLSDIYYGVWQLRERMAIIAWGMAINGVASAALMAAAFALRTGVPGAAAGAALGSGIAFAFVHRRTRVVESMPSDGRAARLAWRRLLRLAGQAAPLGVISLLNALQSSVPRYFIRASTNETALGLFAAAYQLPVAGGIVVGALGSAAVPRLASLHASGDVTAFRALTRKLLLAGALLGGVGVALSALVGGQILSLLYNSTFAAAEEMLVVISAATGLVFIASLEGYALTSARRIAIQPAILGLAVAVLAVACAVLVPRFGGVGAAWAIMAASGTQAVASGVALCTLGNPRKVSHADSGELSDQGINANGQRPF
jgi:O-antigen/teichoic acid export membrane protein